MRRDNWLRGPKHPLANKARGSKGVKVMVDWQLLILFCLSSTERDDFFPPNELRCGQKALGGIWSQDGVSQWRAASPTEAQGPRWHHVSPASLRPLVHLCPFPSGSLRLEFIRSRIPSPVRSGSTECTPESHKLCSCSLVPVLLGPSLAWVSLGVP